MFRYFKTVAAVLKFIRIENIHESVCINTQFAINSAEIRGIHIFSSYDIFAVYATISSKNKKSK